MSHDFPTHSEIGEENVRQHLRRRQEEYVLYGAEGRRFAAGVRAPIDGVERMKVYQATTQFVIGDDENVLDAIDKWLKETVREYEHPSHQFDVKQVITIRTTNDRERS